MADSPVLDLRTVVQGRPVRINGKPYTLRHHTALSLKGQYLFEERAPVIAQLLSRIKTLTPDEEQELSHELDRVCRIVLDAPDKVHELLDDQHRLEIVNAFTKLWTNTRSGTGAKTTASTTIRQTGSKSSRGSRGSTRARGSSTGTSAFQSPS